MQIDAVRHRMLQDKSDIYVSFKGLKERYGISDEIIDYRSGL